MTDKDILKRLGKRVALMRTAKGLTQANLADLCDIERPNLARIEAGNTNPTFLTLLSLSKALSVSVKELVDLSE
jgi:transcriptional regulator with XRE-family HTH domain